MSLQLQDNKMLVQSIADLPVVGQRVMLKRTSPEDAQYLSECYNHIEFRRLFRLSYIQPISAETLEKDLTHRNIPLNKLSRIEWIIYRKQHKSAEYYPIGLTSLVDVNQVHKTAEFQIGIANPNERLFGAATEASFLVMEFGFRVLSLLKLHSFVYGFNHYSQRSTTSLGFTQEGILREQYWDPHEQKHIDLFFNGLLAREFWRNKRIAKLSSRLLGRDITLRNSPSQLTSVQAYTHSKQALSEMKMRLKESINCNNSITSD